MNKSSNTSSIADALAAALFWSWNVIFISFMVLGFAPMMLPGLLASARTGVTPWNFLLYGLLVSLIPIGAVILGFSRLGNQPRKLFALGYVIEWPLMLILIIRLFFIRQVNPAFSFVMVMVLLGMAAFIWYLLDSALLRFGKAARLIRLVGLTLLALASLYAALWIAFYTFPLLLEFIRWLVNIAKDLGQTLRNLNRNILEIARQGLWWVPTIALGFVLGLYSATMFVLAPVAAPWIVLQSWWRSLKEVAGQVGWVASLILVGVVAAASVGLFISANHQPQHRAFALLEDPPTSKEQVRALLDQQDVIRRGLLNAYLAPFRYLSAKGEVVHIRNMYADTFGLPLKSALKVENLYEDVASPLLYDPVHPQNLDMSGAQPSDNVALVKEPLEAAQLYQRFFDQTIVQGERQQIVRAVRSTYSSEQAEAAWQALDEREVYLARQEVTIHEHGDWAEIELFEMYQNQTSDRQEVIYYFSLPESAVLTGVWLGNSPDRDLRFAYQVAPRGAAQAVYREQTRVMKDPALLEQIGPRQYRLRVYPVPPMSVRWDQSQPSAPVIEESPPLYMWMTYQAMAEDHAWPMPQLAVRRNVYWDRNTVRLIAGRSVRLDEETWLPDSAPFEQSVMRPTHRVDLPGGQTVLAIPIEQADLPSLPKDLRLAVVVDRSRSMEQNAAQVEAALDRLAEYRQGGGRVDVYLTSSPYRGEPPLRRSLDELDRSELLYFGGQNAAELLEQFEALRQSTSYDAILVLTDGSGYELGVSPVDVPIPDTPVWLIHLNSDIPIGYDDQTLEALQASGGGVVGDLEQAFLRLAVSLAAKDEKDSQTVVQDVLDGYLWKVLPSEAASTPSTGVEVHDLRDGFTAFAARQLILAEIKRQKGNLAQLETLDQLNALAVEYHIVTPYSSMIVLVEVGQKYLLQELEKLEDRYQREVEAIADTVPRANAPLTGVPEPEEWLLIGLALAILLWYTLKGRMRLLSGSLSGSHLNHG